MRYAGFWPRLLAGLLDFLVFLPMVALYLWASSFSRNIALFIEVPYDLLWPLYSIFFHARWGQNIGKMLAGIRVVRLDGTQITWREAMLRFSIDTVFAVASAISNFIGLLQFPPEQYQALGWFERTGRVGELAPFSSELVVAMNLWVWSELIVLLLNRKRRALHDFIAGTVVVHDTGTRIVELGTTA
jgi:uncharacterized RDD family membrane protein YckC